MSRQNLINIIDDTIDKCENGYQWMIDDAQNIFYSENYFKSDANIKKFSSKANIKLVKQTTVEAILNSNKVYGVLNFASAKHPGGGVLKGSVAQEEALARASSLYLVIKQCEEFYTPVPDAPNYSDRIIYSKPIYVFKNDYGNEVEPVDCEVITCAAPNYNFANLNLEKHKEIIRNRFIKVIKSAIANNQRNLILGAWGCGIFKNPSDINAQIFREVLDEYSNFFDDIIFAIPDDGNYQIFRQNLFDLSDEDKDIIKYNL